MYIKKSVLVTCSILLIIVTAVLTVGVVNPFGFTNVAEFIKFSYVARLTESTYYEDISPTEYMNLALTGLAAAPGDPYTRYLFDQDAQEYAEDLSGSYQGIGLYIENDTEDNTVTVISAIAGTPAEEAGLVTGDKILKIEGEPITGEQITEASSKMRGLAGSTVKIEVLKAATGETVELEVERRNIKLQSVTSQMVTDKIGRLSISQFIVGTSSEFNTKYSELVAQGMEALVLDLRNNPGGYLEEAVKIANDFIDDGNVIVYTLDKRGQRENYNATGQALEMPIVILTNGGSASASEVVSGALKDYDIATLIGEKTYGKGIVQSVYQIGKDSMLSVTSAKYYTPNGVCIHGEGIAPDIEVPMELEKYAKLSQLSFEEDDQLKAAVDYLNQKGF